MHIRVLIVLLINIITDTFRDNDIMIISTHSFNKFTYNTLLLGYVASIKWNYIFLMYQTTIFLIELILVMQISATNVISQIHSFNDLVKQ